MTPALIITAIDSVIQLIEFIAKAKTDLSQNAEFTAEQEAALDAKIAALKTSMASHLDT